MELAAAPTDVILSLRGQRDLRPAAELCLDGGEGGQVHVGGERPDGGEQAEQHGEPGGKRHCRSMTRHAAGAKG